MTGDGWTKSKPKPKKRTVELKATVVIYDTVVEAEDWRRQMEDVIRKELKLAPFDKVWVRSLTN